jgi:DNA-binding HxlR family transcriptional regulator
MNSSHRLLAQYDKTTTPEASKGVQEYELAIWQDLNRPFSLQRPLERPHSTSMLIQQLRELEKDGIVERKVYPEVPPRVEYRLTKVGTALRPALKALQSWAVSRMTEAAKK